MTERQANPTDPNLDRKVILTVVGSLVHEELDAAPEATLTELGVSSLVLFEFVERLERATGLVIPDSELRPEAFATVASVMELLARLRSRVF